MKKKLKVICISDLHTRHNDLTVPDGDVLIFAGDGEFRNISDVINFSKWLTTLPHTEKICICGNHDFYGENNYSQIKSILALNNVAYLENSEYILSNGMKVWGSPITPRFYDWAFMEDRDKIQKYWSMIPIDTDILITHGPAYGILDIADKRYGSLGCPKLLDTICQIKPKYHIFGHIHAGYGKLKKGSTTFINCSILDEDYQIANKPIVFYC